MADERRLQAVVADEEEEEEAVRILGLYNKLESLLILSYLKNIILDSFQIYFMVLNSSPTSCCSNSQQDSHSPLMLPLQNPFSFL